jgi:hypothetical protein
MRESGSSVYECAFKCEVSHMTVRKIMRSFVPKQEGNSMRKKTLKDVSLERRIMALRYKGESIDAKELVNSWRGNYLISQALCIAINIMKEMEYPEYSNIEDMKLLRDELFSIYKDIQQAEEDKWNGN